MALIHHSLEELETATYLVDRNKRDKPYLSDEDDATDMSVRMTQAPAFIRKQLNMTQAQFAACLNIPLSTIQNWEQARVRPDPAARALLTILKYNPTLALAALKKAA